MTTIRNTKVWAYKIPTETPESDGTLDWDHTTLVLVQIEAGNEIGIGYTYADLSSALLIEKLLAKLIKGMDVFDIPAIHTKLSRKIRNLGRDGIVAMAISAIDNALWDLKAKLCKLSLIKLWGQEKDQVPTYGSGGFTNYSEQQMNKQLDLWSSFGMNMVKIKIGRNSDNDLNRIKKIKSYLADSVKLFVDANGAYSVKEALNFSKAFADLGITWFEEPVSSDNIKGLSFLREHAPAPVNITAGEYGYNLDYFRKLLENNAVDIMQADATRCGGFSEFIKIKHVCSSFMTPLSSHCAPYLHLSLACATDLIHMEFFYDHFRIESWLFEGTKPPENGHLKPDPSIPGIGLEFKFKDAEKYLIR
jgi:L-alanine-DL-glutamate epimerase-like enolase superfamily enzyme